MKSNEIDSLRQKIDGIDRSIVDLILQRTEAVEKIGKIKKSQGLPIFRPDRHGAVYLRVGDMVPEALSSGIRAVYREIMSIGMAAEGNLTFLAPDAITAAAARVVFGSSVEIGLTDIPSLIARVLADRNCYGFLSDSDGSLEEILDSEALIYGEAILRPDHRRYLVISSWNCPPSGDDRTSVAASGEIRELIGCIEQTGRDVLRVETFQSAKPGGTCAFLDFPGHKDDADCAMILDSLQSKAAWFRFLGSYPAAVEL